jgi:hypothetical protein
MGSLHTLRTANMYIDSRLSLSAMKLKVCEPMSADVVDDMAGRGVQNHPSTTLPLEKGKKQTARRPALLFVFGVEGDGEGREWRRGEPCTRGDGPRAPRWVKG